jgi:hypothetical protein
MRGRLRLARRCRSFGFLIMVLSTTAAPQDKIRSPFGINARRSVLALMSEVERAFGHSIVERISESSDRSFGEYSVSLDGAPTITLARSDLTEANLVHELMHFKLMAEGYPRIQWILPPQHRNSEMVNELYGILPWLRDPIEHYMFRPAMKAMGIVADPEDIMVLETYLKQKHSKEDRRISILRLFALTLSVEDDRLQRGLLASYERDGLSTEARIGSEMVRQVRDMRPMTPRQEVDCFLACINTFWAGERKATFVSWSSEPLGNISKVTAHLALEFK